MLIRINGFANVANNFSEGIVIETDGFTTDYADCDEYYKDSMKELKTKGEAAFLFGEIKGAKYKTIKNAEAGHKRIVSYIKKYGWGKFKYDNSKFVKSVISGKLI